MKVEAKALKEFSTPVYGNVSKGDPLSLDKQVFEQMKGYGLVEERDIVPLSSSDTGSKTSSVSQAGQASQKSSAKKQKGSKKKKVIKS